MNQRRNLATVSLVLALGVLGSSCGTRTLSSIQVQKFVDAADASTCKRYAPEICEARAQSFELTQQLRIDRRGDVRHKVHMSKKLFCKKAAEFARLNQYVMERGPLTITLAADRRTAIVEADYVEKMPFYEEGVITTSADIYDEVQIAETHDRSVIGIEGGRVKFLSTDATTYVRLVPRHELPLPYT